MPWAQLCSIRSSSFCNSFNPAISDFTESNCARDAVGVRAGPVGFARQRDQFADGGDVETEIARMADETEALHRARGKAALAALGTRRGGQQADLFVIADRLDVAAGAARQVADGQRESPGVRS